MRDQPSFINRIAMESTSELVVYSALRHMVQCIFYCQFSLPVCIRYSSKDFRERLLSIPFFRRKVCAAKERFPLRCKEDRQWPAASTAEDLRRILVYLIYVRHFFPVNLYTYKIPVH